MDNITDIDNYISNNDFTRDFSEGCLVNNAIFDNRTYVEYSYTKFFNDFAKLVSKRCFCKCLLLLEDNLGVHVDTILRIWHRKQVPQGFPINDVIKYFNISNFYASIYREMDYDFFVSFDKYLSQYKFTSEYFLRYRLNRNNFMNVFDNRFFIDTFARNLSYHPYPMKEGIFAIPDGLNFLSSFKGDENGEKIFSYILSTYKFDLGDVYHFINILLKHNNVNYLSILLHEYNFFEGIKSSRELTVAKENILRNIAGILVVGRLNKWETGGLTLLGKYFDLL